MTGVRFILLAISVMITSNVHSHHSLFWYYDTKKPVTIEGTVAKYEFGNPHPYLYLDVTDATGNIEQWEIEWPPAPVMARAGWSKTSVVQGEQITVFGLGPKKERAKALFGMKIIKADGSVLELRGSLEDLQ